MRGAGAPTEGVNLLERGGSEEHAQRKGLPDSLSPLGVGASSRGVAAHP